MKTLFILLCTVLLSCGIIFSAQASTTIPHPTPTSMKKSRFNAVYVLGNIKVQLQQTWHRRRVRYIILSARPQAISAKIINHVLYLNRFGNKDYSPKPIFVRVHIRRLNKLTVLGSASITSKKLRLHHLVIDANTSGSIQLNGLIDLSKLIAKGPGAINIRWIDSPNLLIHSTGSSHIKLAGVVTKLHARLSAHAKMNAKYLRAKTALIQTKDFASAKVLAVNNLRAFAGNYSNIYYYKRPKHFTHFTTESGNVLQLGWHA